MYHHSVKRTIGFSDVYLTQDRSLHPVFCLGRNMIDCKSLSSIFFFVEWLYNSFEMSSSGRGIFADIAVSIL